MIFYNLSRLWNIEREILNFRGDWSLMRWKTLCKCFYQAAFNFLWAAFQSSTLFFKLSSVTSPKISTPKRAGKLYLWCRSRAVIWSNTSWGSSKSAKQSEFDQRFSRSRIYLESYLRCERRWHSSEVRQFHVEQPNLSAVEQAACSDPLPDWWLWDHLQLLEDCRCCYPRGYTLQQQYSATCQYNVRNGWDNCQYCLFLWPFQQFWLL